MKTSLTSVQLCVLNFAIANVSVSPEFIKISGISSDDLSFLVTNGLLEPVVEDNRYAITKIGLNAIKEKHIILSTLGKSYSDFFKSLSPSANNRFLVDAINEGFFKAQNNEVTKHCLIKHLLNSGYFDNLSGDLLNSLYETSVINNINTISSELIEKSELVFKSIIVSTVEKRIKAIDGNIINEDIEVVIHKLRDQNITLSEALYILRKWLY
jgi:hypothetical protein